MAISCGAKCAKAFLIIFNLIYWVAGCALLVMGAWVFLDPTKNALFQLVTTEGVSSNAAYYVAYLLITLGCLVVLVGFFGCCGALQESKCMLVLYFMFLFLMLIAEVAVAIVTLVYREQFLVGLQMRLSHQLNEKYGRNSVDNQLFTESVDLAQYKFNCCGISGDNDYNATKWRLDGQGSNGSRNVPLTCCKLANLDVANTGSPISVVSRVFGGTKEEEWQHPHPMDETACQSSEEHIHIMARHKKGCLKELEHWIKQESLVLVATGTGIAAYQILGMVFSICLCRDVTTDI